MIIFDVATKPVELKSRIKNTHFINQHINNLAKAKEIGTPFIELGNEVMSMIDLPNLMDWDKLCYMSGGEQKV